MAVKAVNNTARIDGLVLTLFVFRTYPWISRDDPPTQSTTEQAKAINLVIKEVAKLYAKRQVTDALRLRNGPNTALIYRAPIRSRVLV